MFNIVLPNLLFGAGVGMTMTVLTTVSMETISNAQMTNASGVQNLLKNIGAAVGTSLVATMVSRYSQAFQHYFVENLSDLNGVYSDKLNALFSTFSVYENYPVAFEKAMGTLYQELIQQATLCAYIESFRIFGVVCFFCLPLLLLYKRRRQV